MRAVPSTPLELKGLAAFDPAEYINENFENIGVYLYRYETVRVAAKLMPDAKFFEPDSFEGYPKRSIAQSHQITSVILRGAQVVSRLT